MAGWTRNAIRRMRNKERGGNDTDISGHSHASHSPGTTIELEERVTNQVGQNRTLESAPNATDTATNGINTSHIERLRNWWSHNVRLDLEHGAPGGGDPRDYLALERTFLGWFRTSVSLISLGVIITQLFVLKDVDPKKGKILGAIMTCGGVIVILLGCVRYFEQQRLLAKGKALSGGWHHQLLIVTLMLILITLLVMIIIDG